MLIPVTDPAFIKIWLLMLILGIMGFPILFALFRNLPERGYTISKCTTLIIITYIGWIAGHYGIAFNIRNLWFITLIFAGASLAFAWFQRNELLKFFRTRFRTIIIIEIIFFVCFAFFIKVVSYNAAIDPDSERMMDYMMIQNILRSKLFPPMDLWMAGETVNYYYFGYAMVAVLRVLSGLPLPVLFNGAVAVIYAMMAASAFGLGYNFTRRHTYALLTMLLMVFAGNLNGFIQLLNTRSLFHINWFASSRIIEGTINEFPYFSFIFGDLHAYALAFPIVFIALFLGLNILFEKHENILFFSKAPWRIALSLIVLPLLLGALIPTNTWDFPAYFALIPVALAIRSGTAAGLCIKEKIRAVIVPTILLLVLCLLAYLPYFATFQQQNRRIGLVTAYRSAFSDFFQIFGIHIMLTLGLILTLLFALRLKHNRRASVMLGCFLLASAFLLFGEITFLYLTAMIILGVSVIVILCIRKRFLPKDFDSHAGKNIVPTETKEHAFARAAAYTIALGAIAAFYGLLSEFFFVDDYFTGVMERITTVFKIHLEMWMLWSAAGSFSIYLTAHILRTRYRPYLSRIWFGVVGCLLGMGLVYTISSTWIRTAGFKTESTLNGMQQNQEIYPADCRAIDWMRNHIKGLPVILEAYVPCYGWGSRFATFAGFPTVLGWRNHEANWRNAWDTVQKRAKDIDTAYTTMDTNQALRILNRYNIEIVVVGSVERRRYPHAALNKFSEFMETIYDKDYVTLYKRVE